MNKEFSKDTEIMKKNWNSENEKLCKSKFQLKALWIDWIKWTALSGLEDKTDEIKTDKGKYESNIKDLWDSIKDRTYESWA
jgi:hypothetical protein